MLPIAIVHPMIVHFPIALLTVAVGLTLINVARGGDVAGREFLANAALGAFALGVLGAVVAVVFGDMALDAALDKGFSEAMIEGHEGWAFTTLATFGGLTGLLALARTRRYRLVGARGAVFALAAVVGFGFLATTAYFGGDLVYVHGVNVAETAPPVDVAAGG